MFRSRADFDRIVHLFKALDPARALIVWIIYRFDVLEARMVRADQDLAAVQVRSKLLGEVHNSQ